MKILQLSSILRKCFAFIVPLRFFLWARDITAGSIRRQEIVHRIYGGTLFQKLKGFLGIVHRFFMSKALIMNKIDEAFRISAATEHPVHVNDIFISAYVMFFTYYEFTSDFVTSSTAHQFLRRNIMSCHHVLSVISVEVKTHIAFLTLESRQLFVHVFAMSLEARS